MPNAKATFSTIIFAAAACEVASLMVAFVLSFQNGIGREDMPALALWTAPLAIGVSVVSATAFRRLSPLANWLKLLAWVVSGAVLSMLWTVTVSSLLGPWFGTFSIPVLFCWLSGALAASFVGSGQAPRGPMGTGVGVVVAVLIGVLGGVESDTLFAFLADDQTLEVVALRIEDASKPFGMDASTEKLLGREGVELLRSSGIDGQVTISSRATVGRGPAHARILLVLQSPLRNGAELQQPRHCAVAYVQQPKGWKMYPPSAPTLPRLIHLKPSANGAIGSFEIDLAEGGRQGGSL